MKQSKKLFASVLAIVALFALSIAPASAHEAPAVLVCEGQASVSPGLTFPGIAPARDFTFSLNGNCPVTLPSGDAATITATGSGNGWCGASTATGEGTVTFSDGHTIGFTFSWTSGGSILIVLGGHGGGSAGVLAGVVQASGGAECLNASGSTVFGVTIAAAAA